MNTENVLTEVEWKEHLSLSGHGLLQMEAQRPGVVFTLAGSTPLLVQFAPHRPLA